MLKFAASDALLPAGWARDVVFTIGDDGTIASHSAECRHGRAGTAAGPVIPAMPNLHSHAFQRALAGRTGRTSPSHDDSFWTWRQAMYAFLDRVDADAFEAIAVQAYVEMAKSGYASVAEFHYVHHDPAGKPYGDPAELAWRVVAAARTAGHRPDAAAGVLRARGFRRHAHDGGTAPLRAHDVHVHASVRASCGRVSARTATSWAWRRTACARSRRRRWAMWCASRLRARRCTSMRRSRPRRSTIALHGATCVRSNGC